MMAREGITIKYLSHTTGHTWSERRELVRPSSNCDSLLPRCVLSEHKCGTRSAMLMVFVRIGCLEWRREKVCISSCRCRRRPPQCHIWETCCRRSLIPLLGLGVRSGGGGFLSLGRPGRDRRRKGWVRRLGGGEAGSRRGITRARERSGRILSSSSPPKATPHSLSVGGYLRSPEEVRERSFERSAREAISHHHRKICTYLLRERRLDEVNYRSAD